MQWLPALAGVGLYDLWLIRSGRESLTGGAKRHRTITLTLATYVVAHLSGLLPESADVFYRARFDRPL